MRQSSGLVAAALFVLLSVSCAPGQSPPADDSQSTVAAIQAFRVEKDASFKDPGNQDSPIPVERRAAFTGLSYFPIDPAYRVSAFLTPEKDAADPIVELRTSHGQLRKMRRVGRLGFTLNSASYSLIAFSDLDAPELNQVFVPFSDALAGTDTYQGGRYIELQKTPTGLYDLDFNRAYNPFCVYNPNYECPVPPRENHIDAAIRAGEKMPARK